ncbi:MAG: V-type ATPase subunit [Treponema sp.]|nr:V-type ATPase subunit [Treponema sp.]
MLAKSFVGPRASQLFAAKSLEELWGLLFSGEMPALPETLLARLIEQNAEKAFIRDYSSLLSSFSKPDDVLVALLRFFDYDNLKEIGAALCYNERTPPVYADIGSYSMLNYKAWPNLERMTEGSPVSWYTKVPKPSEQTLMDTKLDAQYVHELWASVQKLPAYEREPVADLIQTEIAFNNIIWALRLKVFYFLSPEEISSRLVFANPSDGRRDVFAGAALKILEKNTDSWEDWKDWKYADALNPHEEGVIWELDPSYVELSLRRMLNAKALHAFHKHPFTAMVLVSWYKIKLHELDCIRTVAEGLRLNAEPAQVMAAAGESPIEKKR